jgi:alpha-beta hydrolase superfamily lysophospholipase
MPHTEFQLAVDRGPALFAQAWDPPGTVRGIVGIVHGLSEHSGRYAELAEQLNAAGFSAVSFDHRGHGRNGRWRGPVGYPMLLDDVGRLVQAMGDRGRGRAQFLYGHSLGGNLVLNFVLRRQPQLSAAVVSSPLLRLGRRLPMWKYALGRLLARVWPSATFSNGIQPEDLSGDPVPVERYRCDPLVQRRVSAGLAAGILDAGQWALENAARLSLPLLLMHGGADRIASAEASREFAAAAGTDCALKIWEDLLHELHWEQQRAEVVEFMIDWLRRRAA